MEQPEGPGPLPPELTADQVKAALDRGEIVLLDVREPDEWVAGHIEGALWIPLGELEERYKELDPNQRWVTYCHMGGRSAQATDFLLYMGLPEVANMQGGIMAWEWRRYPLVRGR